MPKPFDQLRVLLIQARDSEAIERQEQTCFRERCRIRPEQLVAVNVVRHALPVSLLDDADAMMIGGSGEYSVTQDYAWMPALLDLTRAAVDRALPTFGSCWGHQLVARALGGRVIHDSERAELGCHWVELNEHGQSDTLFADFPARFKANMGHHDRVVELPPGGVELAFNASQPYQAFRLEGLPVYGTQFHSELDAARERERLITYRRYYDEISMDADFRAVLATLAETTEVDHLLHDFLVKFAAEPGSMAA